MDQSELDRAHAAMEDGDDAARLRFYATLADTEVFLLLAGDPDDDRVVPETFAIEGAEYALIFDSEDRLSDFTKRAAPYTGLPARALIGMIAGQGVGLALNPEVAPPAMLIDADAVAWLAETLQHAPEAGEARLVGVSAPKGLPDAVLSALDRKLTKMPGLARRVYLAAAEYADGGRGHVLAFVDADQTAEAALAHAAGEALTFSGVDAGVLDVIFVRSGDTMADRMGRVGIRFDLPQIQKATPVTPTAPGSDPGKPPRLR